MNINISINPTLTNGIKLRLQQSGYSNISEYIRDLLRHDLRLTHDEYPYDYNYIEDLGKKTKHDKKIPATSIDEALAIKS